MGTGKAARPPPSSVPRTVLVDANVLYGATLRDVFMQLRVDDVIRLHWSRLIDDEWIRNLAKNYGVARTRIEHGVAALMKAAAPDWEVDGFESFVGHFLGVDVKDQHVAAAAQKLSLEEHPGQPVALVTQNVKDFKPGAFAGTAVTRYSVANYLGALARESPDRVAASCETMRRRLKHPSQTRSQLLERFREVQACKEFAKQLETEWGLEPKAAAVDAARHRD